MNPSTGAPAAPHPTYGELMDAGRRQVNAAHTLLTRMPFADVAHARAAVTARAELLHALGDNARAVIGPAHLAGLHGVRPAPGSADPRDPRVLQVLRWLDHLDRASTTAAPATEGRPDGGPVTAALRSAQAQIAAATDLALTHFRGNGSARPNAPHVLAAGDLGVLLADTTRLVALAADSAPLALRCRQAGMSALEVDAHLPLHDALVDDTWSLAASWGFPASGLGDLTVSHPAVRVGDPGAEWADRMGRLHARMIGHRDRGHASVRTLQDVARLGTVVSHVLATSGLGDPAAQPAVTNHWQAVIASLAPLRSTEAADRMVLRTVERMLTLASPATTRNAPEARDRLLHAVAASTPLLDSCSAIGERLMATSSDLWIPARVQRPYLRRTSTAAHRASRPQTTPHPWPRPTRTTTPSRTVGLS